MAETLLDALLLAIPADFAGRDPVFDGTKIADGPHMLASVSFAFPHFTIHGEASLRRTYVLVTDDKGPPQLFPLETIVHVLHNISTEQLKTIEFRHGAAHG